VIILVFWIQNKIIFLTSNPV